MNKHNAHLYIPMIQWLSDGELQGQLCGQWEDVTEVLFTKSPEFYRRKPKQTVVPWDVNTCPVGSVVKHKASGTRYLITGAGVLGVGINGVPYDYHRLLEEYTTLDGSPCGTVQP